MRADPHSALDDLLAWAAETPWVTDVWLTGSLASGDHYLASSDIDVVAVTRGAAGPREVDALTALHRRIDSTTGRGSRLGCVYVDHARLRDVRRPHPTWTHGRLVSRPLSPIARAELLQHGTALLGRAPAELLPPMALDDVRVAVRAELDGYWSWAIRRPWVFLDQRMVDLALLTMSRARHTWRTGLLPTKSEAWHDVRAPRAVAAGVRHRRVHGPGRVAISPRGGWHAWRDTRRTARGLTV